MMSPLGMCVGIKGGNGGSGGHVFACLLPSVDLHLPCTAKLLYTHTCTPTHTTLLVFKRMCLGSVNTAHFKPSLNQLSLEGKRETLKISPLLISLPCVSFFRIVIRNIDTSTLLPGLKFSLYCLLDM